LKEPRRRSNLPETRGLLHHSVLRDDGIRMPELDAL
jgi:hypothetical protein